MTVMKHSLNLQYFVVSDIVNEKIVNEKRLIPVAKDQMLYLHHIESQSLAVTNTIHIVKIGWVLPGKDNSYDKILSVNNVKLTIFCNSITDDLEKLSSKYKNITILLAKTTQYINRYIYENNIKFILHIPNDVKDNDNVMWSGSIAMALNNSLILITTDKIISRYDIPKEYSISYNDRHFDRLLFGNHIRDVRDNKILEAYKNKIFQDNYTLFHRILNYKFRIQLYNGLAESNSHSYQDLFVINANKCKHDGYFIEIGSAWPKFLNNTYILETELNWKGIMIEYDNKYLESYKQIRPNSIHVMYDSTKIDYLKLLQEVNAPFNIDYLQIDLDVENESTLNTLKLFDTYIFDKYKFATITFEHDFYRGDYFNTRYISRQILHKRGYVLLFPDVSVGVGEEYKPYEDWWVHPDLIDADYIQKHYNSNVKPIISERIFLQ